MIDYNDYMEAFNAVAAKDKIVEWIREWFLNHSGGGDNCIIGISGGKDSSVVAALCAEALGRERVYGITMPNGEQNDIDDSMKLVNHLGIHHFNHNIINEYEDILSQVWGNLIEVNKRLSAQTKINLGPRLRMSVLYAYSQSLNGRVACTDNLSESYIGYSTRWGDSVGDFAPIAAYTSDEVIAIGRTLHLPEELLVKAPADGLCGKTDENNFGFTYRALNEYIRLGQIEDMNVKKKIDHLHNINAFKRQPIATFTY